VYKIGESWFRVYNVSISTATDVDNFVWVSLATFATGRHCMLGTTAISNQMFHYYSLGGDSAMPGGLHARLCHAFLVLF